MHVPCKHLQLKKENNLVLVNRVHHFENKHVVRIVGEISIKLSLFREISHFLTDFYKKHIANSD